MKAMKLLAVAAILIVSTLIGFAQFSDNFDSYADDAAFDAAWTINAGVGLNLNTAQFVSSPNSVKNTTTSAAGSRKLFASGTLDSAPTDNFTFGFSFYDYGVSTGARDYGMLYGRTGTDWAGGLLQVIAIGKYNIASTNAYWARIAIGTGNTTSGFTWQLGDGAVAGSTSPSGWFYLSPDLGDAPTQSVGWHTAEVVGTADPDDPGKALLKFYIDGQLGGSVGNINRDLLNWIVLGSGVSSAGGYLAFDDVFVTIPEPSAVALGLLGGLGLLWLVRRRAA